eukprot:UN11638
MTYDPYSNFTTTQDGKTCIFQPLDTIEIIGLKSKTEYNGCRGIIINYFNKNNRFPVQIMYRQKSVQLLIKPDNLKSVGIPDNIYTSAPDAMKNGITQQSFKAMNDAQKKDVLLSRIPIFVSPSIPFLDFIKQHTGSDGSKCDGCNLTETQYNRDPDHNTYYDHGYPLPTPTPNSDPRNLLKKSFGFISKDFKRNFIEQVCPNCKYSVCEDCIVHCSYRGGVDRGVCFCRDSNLGNEYPLDKSKRLHYQYGIVTKKQRKEQID